MRIPVPDEWARRLRALNPRHGSPEWQSREKLLQFLERGGDPADLRVAYVENGLTYYFIPGSDGVKAIGYDGVPQEMLPLDPSKVDIDDPYQ